MPFVVQTLSVDLMHGTANLVAFDSSHQPAKILNVQFPFTGAGAEGEAHQPAAVTSAAKVILQQALNEL